MTIVERIDAQLMSEPLLEPDHPHFSGTVAQWADDLAQSAALGVSHAFFSIDAADDAALAALAELRRLVV